MRPGHNLFRLSAPRMTTRFALASEDVTYPPRFYFGAFALRADEHLALSALVIF